MQPDVNFDNIPSHGDRYCLNECLGGGVFGTVFIAIDTKASNRRVAIKCQELNATSEPFVKQEYKILCNFSGHANIPDFYGIYRKGSEIWFVMELCEGGTVADLVNGLLKQNRRMREEHIAYILKETVKALLYLHGQSIIHRDIKAKNILLTKDGEVKLIDFGSSRLLRASLDKTKSLIGSPAWLAPEMIESKSQYDNRSDVWSLGITAIELGDGAAPYGGMHPSRILFQIVRNPPPMLARPTNWTETYNDFVSECLVKNPEHRPYMAEVVEHPFLEQIPKNDHHLTLEMRSLIDSVSNKTDHTNTDDQEEGEEVAVVGKRYKTGVNGNLQVMYVEDLAALNKINEETIIKELEIRLVKLGQYQTFVGDVLLVLNPNEKRNLYDEHFQKKYKGKMQSDNAPHIFAVADNAYKNALHHVVPQRIVLSGESGSGKTTNYLHLVNQLLFLGENALINHERIKGAIKLIHSLTHASTPINDYSTRCVLTTEIRYGNTGKVTGANFNIYQLEKWRISSVDMFQGNFHILYYFYDGLKESRKLNQYKLNSDRQYRYLRLGDEFKSRGPKINIEQNLAKFKHILKILEDFEFTDIEMDTIFKIVASILIIGEIRIQELDGNEALIENRENVNKVAELLEVDADKLAWAFTNYCVVHKGAAVRRKSTVDEARDARDVLANNMYARMVDYIIGCINEKLKLGQHIFGDKYSIKIFDYFGFECFKRNHLPQLFVNTFNEQLQYHYLQRVFSWECLDIKEENIDYQPIRYFNNKTTLDLLLNKTEGVLSFIDEASKKNQSGKYIIEFLKNAEKSKVFVSGNWEFAVCHYTGKVNYDAKEMADKNRDFLPPELIETLRLSNNQLIKSLFTNKLNKTGNLIMTSVDEEEKKTSKRSYRYELQENEISSKYQYSQIKRIRTSVNTFKALSLELLKELSIGSGSGATHFVRCITTDLKSTAGGFNRELVKQQIRALAVVETAKARQNGYPHRIPFAEFLRRYQFLAFDFNENVEITRDNCRLLLVRLNLEDFSIGKTKVFLKYYHEEYLAKLYNSQVKKIIKIQTILRGFLAKCNVAKQKKVQEKKYVKAIADEIIEDAENMTEDEAAAVIQKAYRKATIRKSYPDFAKDYTVLDNTSCKFIRKFAEKWKNKSIFHVLLQYRAIRMQDVFNFSQQVHLFNIAAFYDLQQINDSVAKQSIDCNAQVTQWLGQPKLAVNKIPFQLNDIPFYDAAELRNSLTNPGASTEKDDNWDTPYRWRELINPETSQEMAKIVKTDENLINLPFKRDPNSPIRELSDSIEEDEGNSTVDKQNQGEESRSKDVKEEENKYLKKNQAPSFIKKSPVRFEGKKNFHETNANYDIQINSSAKLANNDFDYIKALSVNNKPRNADPVAELRQISRKSPSANSDNDDPPFNFQGMLRKTNYRRDEPIQREVTINEFPLRKNLRNIENNKSLTNGIGDEKKVRVELAPGIYLEGVEVDL